MNKSYLSDVSPSDKPWDVKRSQTQDIANLYELTELKGHAARMNLCSDCLTFGVSVRDDGQSKHRLTNAHFCRVRHCPTCQWRKQLARAARFHKAIPKLLEENSTLRFLFLTLTIKNCELEILRQSIFHLHKSFERLYRRKACPGIGYIRGTEVTRGSNDLPHPHCHAILAVNSSYFKSRKYLNHARWVDLWKTAAQLDYDPFIHVQAVKESKTTEYSKHPLYKVLTEVAKYLVKPDDLIYSPEWLEEFTKQMKGIRSLSCGGLFREYMSDDDTTNEEMVSGDSQDSIPNEIDKEFIAKWNLAIRRYAGYYRSP